MADLDRPRVLFADDNRDILQALVLTALAEGWYADGADTAEGVLELVNRNCRPLLGCYDLIVTDVSFSHHGVLGMTGISAARSIREKYPDLPILFLTGYDGPMTRENVKDIPNADVQQKGIPMGELMRRIRRVIRWKAVRYTGPERRRTSVNRTHHRRRSTDEPVVASEVLKSLIASIRRTG